MITTMRSWMGTMVQLLHRETYLIFLFLYFSVVAPALQYKLSDWPSTMGLLARSAAAIYLFVALLMLAQRIFPDFPRRRFIYRALVWPAMALHIFIGTVAFVLYLHFDQKITRDVVFILCETNLNDGLDFFRVYGSLQTLPLLIFLGFPILLRYGTSFRRCQSLVPLARKVFLVCTAGLAAAGLLLIAVSGQIGYHPSYRFLKILPAYLHEIQAYQAISKNLEASDLAGKVSFTSTSNKQIAVLIIGESTARRHMSNYGYFRPTTPMQEALADELFVFRDVLSPHSHTQPVLKKLFTFYNNDAPGNWYDYPSLINVFKAAGYKTFWISNQEAFGLWARVGTALGNQADVSYFHDLELAGKAPGGLPKDGVLLSYLDSVLRKDVTEKKLIILHLMGTHSDYRDRYPPAFAKFDHTLDMTPRANEPFLTEAMRTTIDQYDNAVLYNDWLVSEIIERVRARADPSFVLSLPDHGEEVYEFRDFLGHTEAMGTKYMIEIPFVLWLSNSYRTLNPDKVTDISKSLDQPYMTDDAINTVLDLAGLEYERFDPTRSIVNPRFDASRQRVYGGKAHLPQFRSTAGPSDSR